ncbi:MAG TPA: hypothetical protein PKH32_03995 [Verrucomicrobiota bacterium]|nr:hypothetical protein [Verrucomicrobiota bacterium]
MKARTVISSRNRNGKKPSPATKQFRKALDEVEPILAECEEKAQDILESVEWVHGNTRYWDTAGVGFIGNKLVFVCKRGRGAKPEITPIDLREACESLEVLLRAEALDGGGDIETSDAGQIKFWQLVSKSVS